MPRKDAPEFSYDEKTGLYRKRIKNPGTGKWVAVYGHTKQELREIIKLRQQVFAAEAAAAGAPYVYQYATQWFQLNTKELSQSRKGDYSNAINNHICPVIGHMQISEVKPDDIKRIMAAVSGMSKSSQQKIVTTLKRIFESAEENGIIAKSPCTKLRPGGAPPKEKRLLQLHNVKH